MTIYRGPGGTGSATSDADTTLYQDFLNQTIAARDAALQAETNAELAETNAETAEANAETAEANAAASASAAATSASNASTSASNAASSASSASSSASAASTSASNAATSASSAAASASAALTSENNAETAETNAAASASAAATSASNAATSATNAANSASSASTSATNAANSATSASNSASSAATSATNAANSATSASNSASAAAASASEAAGYAASINPADLVHISGTETITGAKTFSQTITGSITGNAGTVTNGVYTTGDQTIAGTKTFSSNPIVSSGVANGVCYLNGSKVLTTGSALTFDGTNLGLGVTPQTWGSNYKVFELAGASAGVVSAFVNNLNFGTNFRNDNTNWIYTYSGQNSTRYEMHNSGQHRWYIAPSGTAGNAISFTQAMTLDASGNLGVGTSSPSVRLHAEVTNSTNAGAAVAILRQNGAGNNGVVIDVASTPSNYVADFRIANSSVTRIDSSGNLLVGATSQPNPGFTSRIAAVQPNANAIASMDATNASGGWGIIMRYTASAPNGTGNDAFSFQDSSATRFTVRSNGGIANFQANNVNLSDRREKTNFAPAGEYLSKICAIPVQTFNYIDQNMEEDPGLTLGVVAQDVQAVAPELVMESNWGTEENPKMRLSIYQTDLQYALMKCIQEQQAIIVGMKAELDALKAKVGA